MCSSAPCQDSLYFLHIRLLQKKRAIGYILRLNRDNGKENGNYHIIVILNLNRDNGEEHGNHYI